MSKRSPSKETYSILQENDLNEEVKEIEDFFIKVDSVKSKILNHLEKGALKDLKYLQPEQLYNLLNENMNLLKVITKETVDIYIDCFFEKNSSQLYIFSHESLETFLTSILIFAEEKNE